jgi:hypothetical protein
MHSMPASSRPGWINTHRSPIGGMGWCSWRVTARVIVGETTHSDMPAVKWPSAYRRSHRFAVNSSRRFAGPAASARTFELSGSAGEPLHIEVQFTFEWLDFRITREERRAKFKRCGNSKGVCVRDGMTGLQLGRSSHSSLRCLFYRYRERASQSHSPERGRLVGAIDAHQAIVRLTQVDDGRHALRVAALGVIEAALNSRSARFVLQPGQPGKCIETKPSASLHAGAPLRAASARPSLWRIRARIAIRPDALHAVGA